MQILPRSRENDLRLRLVCMMWVVFGNKQEDGYKWRACSLEQMAAALSSNAGRSSVESSLENSTLTRISVVQAVHVALVLRGTECQASWQMFAVATYIVRGVLRMAYAIMSSNAP